MKPFVDLPAKWDNKYANEGKVANRTATSAITAASQLLALCTELIWGSLSIGVQSRDGKDKLGSTSTASGYKM